MLLIISNKVFKSTPSIIINTFGNEIPKIFGILGQYFEYCIPQAVLRGILPKSDRSII